MKLTKVIAAVMLVLGFSGGAGADERVSDIGDLLRSDLVQQFTHECSFRTSSCNTNVTDTVDIYGCAPTPGKNFANYHKLTIPAGRRVTIRARSASFSTLLVLFDSTPAVVKQANAPKNAEASLTYDTTAGGEYVVAVAPIEDFGVGTYTLSITCDRVTEPPPPPCTSTCTPNDNTACMLGGRFKATMTWRDPFANAQGDGRVIRIAGLGDDQTFWSMYPQAPNNIELVIRMVDGRGANGKFWVSTAGFAVAEYTATIQDTRTCAVWRRTVAAGSPEIVRDAEALPGN